MGRPLWQNPTAITTVLAIIATIVLIIVVNSKPAVSTNPAVLNPPANPVAASIPRQGTILGSPSAPVRVDAWEDFQCPYCQIWTIQWEPHVVDDFVATGVVRYQFHDFSFIGSGHTPDESLDAAVAASCASDQGKFWPYHDWLYANQNPAGENQGWFVRSRLDAIAQKVGLDQATFDTCLADPAKPAAIQAEQRAGAALGVTATPAIFVDGKLQTLTTYPDFAAAIRALASAPAASSSASSSP
ncbi:MAG TPA: thioredoxin domain-containing protein [Candidatus Limnocylindrales bacterium]|nr:thioredoxin domain-containing protein [Candidatus Limnocylindrales bacterium]